MLLSTCFCLSALLLAPAVAQTCNRNTGPSGSTACISISTYYGRQYATCLTNVYIQRKSGYRHACIDFTATYCWYQCMLEHYGANSGIVNSACSCDGSVIPTSASIDLPAHCYSPSGEDCTWYTNCLEKKYPCGAEAGYALAFGKKYCELYAQNYRWFSSDLTKKWVDATRQCLQLALVPLIRPYVRATCEEIKTTALDSHVGCYTSREIPHPNRPSICDLFGSNSSSDDLLKILWTIRSAFVEFDWRVSISTWSGILKTLTTCGGEFLHKISDYVNKLVTRKVLVVFKLTLQRLRSSVGRTKRTTVDAENIAAKVSESINLPNSFTADSAKISAEFSGALSDAMDWKARGIEGLPLSANYDSSQDVVLHLLIGDRSVINFEGINSTSSIDLNVEVERMKLRVASGSINLQLNDGQFYLRQMSDCTDSTCQNTKSTTVAPYVPKGSAKNKNTWTLIASSAVFVLLCIGCAC